MLIPTNCATNEKCLPEAYIVLLLNHTSYTYFVYRLAIKYHASITRIRGKKYQKKSRTVVLLARIEFTCNNFFVWIPTAMVFQIDVQIDFNQLVAFNGNILVSIQTQILGTACARQNVTWVSWVSRCMLHGTSIYIDSNIILNKYTPPKWNMITKRNLIFIILE